MSYAAGECPTHPLVSRDVPPGQSWAFRHHRDAAEPIGTPLTALRCGLTPAEYAAHLYPFEFADQPEACRIELARRLRSQRERAAISARELAREVGISPSYLCRIEHGERRLIPIIDICAALLRLANRVGGFSGKAGPPAGKRVCNHAENFLAVLRFRGKIAI